MCIAKDLSYDKLIEAKLQPANGLLLLQYLNLLKVETILNKLLNDTELTLIKLVINDCSQNIEYIFIPYVLLVLVANQGKLEVDVRILFWPEAAKLFEFILWLLAVDEFF